MLDLNVLASNLLLFLKPLARRDIEVNRKLTGGRERLCVANIRCSILSHLTSFFQFEDLTFITLARLPEFLKPFP
jgi:hypothetical protein